MKKSVLASVTLATMLLPTIAFAEGFGIIEYHAEGVAMGGAAMFIDNDAGNMGYNPAGITLCKGEQVKVSATYISPHGYAKTYGINHTPLTAYNHDSHRNRVHPAWAPGTYYVRKVGENEWYGLGCFSRFGNMSSFEKGTLPATSNAFAKMNGLSITPTYARRTGNKFYWAVGADINYVGLELQKNFENPVSRAMGLDGNNQTEGETWALGWNVGMRYAATKKDEIGFAYRSKIAHTMDADFDWYGADMGMINPGYAGMKMNIHTTAHGKVTLPDSYHLGYSHKFDDKNRVEVGAIRTQWHNFRTLVLTMDNGLSNTSAHNWEDNWRYAIGYEHKFSKKYTGMLGFAYDDSCIPYNGGDFMVPTGSRKTYSAGVKYHDDRHTIALALGWQIEGRQSFSANNELDAYKSAHTYDCIAKIFSIGYTYHF